MKDERKTKKQLIEELDAERQKRAGVDLPGLGRQFAVEQMRAATMDMRATSDLRIVVAVLFRHMRALGIDTPAASIHFVDEEAATVTGYVAGVDPRTLGFARDDDPAQERFVVVEDTVASGGQRRWPSQDRPTIVAPWRSGQIRTYSRSAEETVFVDNFVRVYGMAMADAQGFADQVWQGDWEVTNVPFRYGVVGYREREHHPEHDETVTELARGLELGSLRFLDFQRLEAQNRDLEVERALERVRIQVAAMERSADLPKVVQVVEDSLKELGVVSEAVGINVVDRETGDIAVSLGLATSVDVAPIDRDTRDRVQQVTPKVGTWRQWLEHWRAGDTWSSLRTPETCHGSRRGGSSWERSRWMCAPSPTNAPTRWRPSSRRASNCAVS